MRMRRRVIGLLIAAGLLGPPALAAGQGADDAQSKKIAADEFAKGKQLFAAGSYDEAAVAFVKAYEAAPHQAVLANIALCHDKAGRYPEAVIYYRRYIADPVQKGKNAEIRQRLQELKNEIGELDIECLAAGCSIRVDGEDRGAAPVNVVVEPGSHKIEGVVDGEIRETIMERADAGTVVRVRLRAERAAAEAAPATPEQPAPAPAPPPAERAVKLRAPFWIATGVTGAAGALTIAFGALTIETRDDYEASGYTDADLKETGERNRLLTNVMIGVTAAAGAAAVAFAIYDLVSAGAEEPAGDAGAEVALVPGPGAGLGVAGAF
jgi:tetratricopeptide (TPR) repeat protein